MRTNGESKFPKSLHCASVLSICTFFSGVLTKYPFRLPRRTKQRTNRPVTQSCKNRKKGKIHYLRVRLASSSFFFQKRCQKESHSSSFGTVTSIQMYLRIVPRLLLFPNTKKAYLYVIDCVLRTRNTIVNYRRNFTTYLVSIFPVCSAP